MEDIFFQPPELGVFSPFYYTPSCASYMQWRELIVGSIETNKVNKML